MLLDSLLLWLLLMNLMAVLGKEMHELFLAMCVTISLRALGFKYVSLKNSANAKFHPGSR